MRIVAIAAAFVLAGCSSLSGGPAGDRTGAGMAAAGDAETCMPERWARILYLSTKPEVDEYARVGAARYQAGDAAGCMLELHRAEYKAHEALPYD